MRRLLAIAAALFATTGGLQAAGGDVVVAYRADAAPFSSLGDAGYEGFIADLCEQAVPRAGYSIGRRVEVTASTREGLMGDAGVDLVCDPTTVTVERAGRFDFSPILFIANSTYLKSARPHHLTAKEIARSEDCARIHAEDPSRDLVGVGMLVGATASATYELARETGQVGDTLEYSLCTYEFESHEEGIAEVCDGFVSYYFGDMDIMLAEMRRQGSCEASRADGFRAYEPYAVTIPSDDGEFRRRVIAALYGMFADGTALRIYKETFETEELQEPLRTLFSVNNVPRGEAAPTD